MVSMKKKKEPYPTVIRRTGKPPTKAQLKEMRDKVIALSRKKNGNKQSSDEDKPMTKKNDKKTEKVETTTRKKMTPENIARMILEWDDKTTAQWADEFGVSYQTVLKMAEVIRKEDKTLCPVKKPRPRTRKDVAKAGIALFRKKKGKK